MISANSDVTWHPQTQSVIHTYAWMTRSGSELKLALTFSNPFLEMTVNTNISFTGSDLTCVWFTMSDNSSAVCSTSLQILHQRMCLMFRIQPINLTFWVKRPTVCHHSNVNQMTWEKSRQTQTQSRWIFRPWNDGMVLKHSPWFIFAQTYFCKKTCTSFSPHTPLHTF